MKRLGIKRAAVASITALVLSLTAISAKAGLSMDDMVGDYTASTVSPNSRVSLDSRRGFISGGSARVRFENKEMPELYNITLPSFKADCNGMDMNLGALSWISADEFMDAARAMASPQVLVYALQLALNQMCGPCAQLMSDLQDKLNKYQDLLKKSCQEIGTALYEKSGMKEGAAYLENKFWGEAQQSSGNDAAETEGKVADEMLNAGKQELVSENIVWDHLKDVTVGGWIAEYSSETIAKQMVMSMSGTVVTDATGASDASQIKRNPFNPDPPSLTDLLNGSYVRGINCGTENPEECLKPKYGAIVELDPLADTFFKMLDPSSPDSIPRLFAIHYDGIRLTPEQTAFLSVAKQHMDVVYLVRRLAMSGQQIPTRVATFLSEWMAIEIALEMMLDYADTANIAMSNIDNKDDIDMLNIYELKENYRQEASVLRQELEAKFSADASIAQLVNNVLNRTK